MQSPALILRPEMGLSLVPGLSSCPATGPGCRGNSPSCTPLRSHVFPPRPPCTRTSLDCLPIWTMALQPSVHPCPLTGGVYELLRYCAGLHPHGCLRGPGEPPVLGARRPEEPLAVRQLQGDGGWLPSAHSCHPTLWPRLCFPPSLALGTRPGPPTRQAAVTPLGRFPSPA